MCNICYHSLCGYRRFLCCHSCIFDVVVVVVTMAAVVYRDAVVSFLVGLVQEFEEAMYCPNKRKEYVAAAVAAAAAAATTSITAESTTKPLSETNSIELSTSPSSSSSSTSSSLPGVHNIEFFEVSPTYEALLRGELQQQRVLDDMLAKVCTLSFII